MNEIKFVKVQNEIKIKWKTLTLIFVLVSCLALSYLFKGYLVALLAYLQKKSDKNEFHLVMTIIFAFVSLPIVWAGYSACVLTCAIIFSFFHGFVLVVIYSFIGMTISFIACRYVLRDWSNKFIHNMAYIKVISSMVESDEKGFRVILCSRLVPIPFGITNCVFSSTKVNYEKFILASSIGLMPSQLVMCYIGSTIKSLTDESNETTYTLTLIIFVVQLSIAVGLMYHMLNLAKNELGLNLNSRVETVQI